MSKPTFAADGLVTYNRSDFLNDPRFRRAYAAGVATGHRFGADLHIEWRVYVACWAAEHALRIDGDFVECGVNTGILTRAVIDYVGLGERADRTLWLLDTFNGIPEQYVLPQEQALMRGMNTLYTDCLAQVEATFAPFSNVRIVPGPVPDTLPAVTSERIAWLSIDMNNAVPELAALEWFWPRLVPGAVVVLDDYGFHGHEIQKRGMDTLAARYGTSVLAMPTGQGLLFKA
jgi:O-methyltransferase